MQPADLQKLVREALRYTSCRGNADNAVSDAITADLDRFGDFNSDRARTKVRGYVSNLNRKQRIRREAEEFASTPEATTSTPIPEELIYAVRDRLFESTPQERHEVIQLRIYEQMSVRGIEKATGLSKSTVARWMTEFIQLSLKLVSNMEFIVLH